MEAGYVLPTPWGLAQRRMFLGSAPSNQITELLARWSEGEIAARETLIPLIYEELRRVARHCLAGERPDHTLQSAALVHEAYLRLVEHSSVRWDDRVHFFAVAAQLMRLILVDHARKKSAGKRGGDRVTVTLEEQLAPAKQRELDVVALDDALKELSRKDPQQSRIVELRFLAGLSIEETAKSVGVSPATVKHDWAVARVWLCRELARSTPQ
jgi:RNA polymerase sigma factor (TIGR02999 family)